jgi:hypothetical protein
VTQPKAFLYPPVAWMGKRYKTVREACRAHPADAKRIRLTYAATLSKVAARMAPPPEPDPGDLPEVYPVGLEPEVKPNMSKAAARRARAAIRARAKRPEPDEIDRMLASLTDLPPMQGAGF